MHFVNTGYDEEPLDQTDLNEIEEQKNEEI